MATMSYCAFENTAADMRVSLEKLSEMNGLEDLDQHERGAFHSLRRLCQRFLDDSEGFIDEEKE